MDQFSLLEPVDSLRQGVVIAVATTANRWFDTGFRQSLRVADGEILGASVTVMDRANRASRRETANGSSSHLPSAKCNLDPMLACNYNAGSLPPPLSQFDYRSRQATQAELMGSLVDIQAIS